MTPIGIIIIIKTNEGNRLLKMTPQEEQRVTRAVTSTYGRNLRVEKGEVTVGTAAAPTEQTPEPPPAEEPKEKEEKEPAPIVENPFKEVNEREGNTLDKPEPEPEQPAPEPSSEPEPSAEPEPEPDKPKRQYRRSKPEPEQAPED